MKNIYRDGVLGVVCGDALGCPVQFETREEVAQHPITGMRGHGTFDLPEGSWTDDSSLTLATLSSISEEGTVSVTRIADNFVRWLEHGEFTPYGYAYDIGRGCYWGIKSYEISGNPKSGWNREDNNGNGSLMRIMPACLACYELEKNGLANEEEAVAEIENVSAITHGHQRAKIACVIYYFMVKEILGGNGSLIQRLQEGINRAFEFYGFYENEGEASYYNRIRNLEEFKKTPVDQIRSTGYVVDTIEAAIWSLINTDFYKDALLKAVNLGGDTDTIGAVAGGLAGLYYGSESIPEEWLSKIKLIDWIEELCDQANG